MMILDFSFLPVRFIMYPDRSYQSKVRKGGEII